MEAGEGDDHDGGGDQQRGHQEHPAGNDSAVLAGARDPDQVMENARAADIQLDESTLEQLNAATDPVKARLCPNLDIINEAARSAIR